MTGRHRRWAGGLGLAAGGLAAGLCALLLFGCQPAARDGAGHGDIRNLPPAARPLAPLFQALEALQTGERSNPVVIIQIGDSHTANDRFSGRMRELFQERFGAAGRGMLPPGVPFDYYRPTLVHAEQSSGWQVANSFATAPQGLFGLSGFRVRGSRANDVMTLESTEPAGFDRLALEFVRQPGGGTIAVAVDGARIYELPTAGEVAQAARLDLPVTAGSHRLEVRPNGDGPVDLLSWTVERTTPGVIYENQGIVGATVSVMDAWEPATLAWQLHNRNPALVLLVFGTNEGFKARLEREAYATAFATRLATLKSEVPDAAILVVGPPDGNRLPRGCRDARHEGRDFQCAPLSPAEQQNYTALFGQHQGNVCRWHPPPNLAMVREVQRDAAAAAGVYFWDWSTVMGGACGIHRWAVAEPPLAHDDHVHLRADGYRTSAETLFRELMGYYDTYRTGRAARVSEAAVR